ncbi:MAG: lipopolysaccharide biosynthesis protein [Pyrinomonadaceae bacterium]
MSADPADIVTEKSERQTSGWDIRNAPRNYAALIGFQAGSALFSFGSVYLITQNLGRDGYGGIIAVIAASQVAQVLTNWTAVAVVRFGVEEFVETRAIARVFWVRLITLTVNLILVIAAASLWFPPLAGWLKLAPETFWLVLGHFAATAFWVHVQMSLQAVKLPLVQGALQMVERLMIFAGIALLLGMGMLTGGAAMACFAIAPAVMAIAGFIRLLPFISARFSVDAAFVRKVLIYSLPLVPFYLVGYFSGSYVDAVFISNYLSTADLGVYSVATQIAAIAIQLPTLANTLLLPLFITLQSESQKERSFDYFRHMLPGLTLLWGVGCAVLAFVMFFAIPLVFGAEYTEATRPLWILLAASVAAIPVAIGYSPVTNATSRTYIASIAAIAAAVTNIACNAVLIPKYGLIGCAAASLFAAVAATFAYAVALKLSAGVPLSWNTLAVVPSIASVAFLVIFPSPVWAGLMWLVLSFIIVITFRHSVTKAVAALSIFKRTA